MSRRSNNNPQPPEVAPADPSNQVVEGATGASETSEDEDRAGAPGEESDAVEGSQEPDRVDEVTESSEGASESIEEDSSASPEEAPPEPTVPELQPREESSPSFIREGIMPPVTQNPNSREFKIQVKLPNKVDPFVLESGNILISISPTQESLVGVDGRRYRIPSKAIVPKDLFPQWEKYTGRRPLIEFKGTYDQATGYTENNRRVPRAVIVPGFSART